MVRAITLLMSTRGFIGKSLFVFILELVLYIALRNGHGVALNYLREYAVESLWSFVVTKLLVFRADIQETFVTRLENLHLRCS